MAVTTKCATFLYVTPFILVEAYWCFWVMSVNFYQTVRCDIKEDSILHENLVNMGDIVTEIRK